jgi:cellulose synthase/poly-beta-1,6-N-acetylglucosamine synthase-like glycosyltransferase
MSTLPWLSILIIGKKTLRRFLPGSIFMSLYLIAEGRFAEKKKWWWFPYSVKPNVLAEFPLIFGPFIVGSLWILKYTYGKFNLYLLVNILIDSFFTYFGLKWFKKIGYVSLIRLSKIQLSIVFLIKTIVLYGFQIVYEKWFPFSKDSV